MAYATETLTALPFGAVIGGPLKAAIEAQGLAAKTTVDFIQTVGFEPKPAQQAEDVFSIEPVEPNTDSDAELGPVRNVTFSYQIEKADGTKQLAVLTVPILTIVPIPFIRIDEMTIDFTAKIVEQQVSKLSTTAQSESRTAYGGGGSYSVGGWWWRANASFNFNAAYSSKHTQAASSASRYQTEYTVNVHLRAVQDDMPAGLSKVLGILSDTIKEVRQLPDAT